jgi:CRP-like cAMP-binding protein
VSTLAQIERVLFLQDVELFSHCEAAQIMRIAAIASERDYASGEKVFAINDPSDAIYCVVRGSVRIDSPTQQQVSVSPGSAFGVFDLLSGRLRTLNATAETDTLTLVIDGDDFFDLLSNNIGIVRALARFLADRVTTPLAW